VSPGAVALVAMGATFGACTGAAFTSIVFAFELTQDYSAILPIMLAAVLADLVASALLRENLMTEKLARRGLGVPHGYEPDRLRSTFVREVMSTAVNTIPATATVGDARDAIEDGQHSAYPLVDEGGRCVGIVTRGDVLASADDGGPVTDVASRDVVTVGPDDPVLTVLERMADEQVDHIPVLDGDRLVGVCTRTDVLRVRSRGLEHERPQPGVLSAWSRPWTRLRAEARSGSS
jgi:CBS domain-containing protein